MNSLSNQVEKATILITGIGGTTAFLQIDDTPVFVKIVPLTELESHSENFMSTRNIFNLPPYCQYGIGSPGYGVWREVAAHTMTTNWVLAKQCENFPLMYHWRVLKSPERCSSISEELSDVSHMVEFWGTSKIQGRIEALEESNYNVVLFCEYIPYNLHNWLTEQIAIGENTANSLIELLYCK